MIQNFFTTPIIIPRLGFLNLINNVDGHYSIKIDEARFDFLLQHKKNSEYLFVLLSGAKSQDKPLPYFNRWQWTDVFPGTMMCISDPMLFLNPNLIAGWYIGPYGYDWINSMAKLVLSYSNMLNIPPSRIIIYGSSVGGFAALKLASEIRNSFAIAINCQTNILQHNPQYVQNLLETAYPNYNVNNLPKEIRQKFSASYAIKQNKTDFLIVQNVNDEFHYNTYYLPFEKKFKNKDNENKFYLYQGRYRHEPESKFEAYKILKQAFTIMNERNLNCI